MKKKENEQDRQIKDALKELKDAWNGYVRISNFKKKVARVGSTILVFTSGIVVGVWIQNR